MVHLTELRIVLPFTCACQGPGAERDATGRAHGGEGGGVRGCAVEEFKRGQRYANWRTNEDATEPGQGGTVSALPSALPALPLLPAPPSLLLPLLLALECRAIPLLCTQYPHNRCSPPPPISLSPSSPYISPLSRPQLLSSTPYYHEQHGEGLFTHSLFRLGNRLPDWVNRLVPPSVLVVDEKSWINYPYFRTIITIPFFSKVRARTHWTVAHSPTPSGSPTSPLLSPLLKRFSPSPTSPLLSPLLKRFSPSPTSPLLSPLLKRFLPFPHFPTPFSSLEKILPFPHFPTPFSSLEKILPFPHFPTPFSSLEKILPFPHFPTPFSSLEKILPFPHFPTPFSSLEKILPFPHFPTPFSSLEKILPFPHFPTPFSSLEKILPFPHFPTPFSSLEKILPFPHFPTPFSSLEKILPFPHFPTPFLPFPAAHGDRDHSPAGRRLAPQRLGISRPPNPELAAEGALPDVCVQGWQKRERPLMCAYKVVRAQAEYWGVQNSAERLLINSLRQIFLLAHKNCFGLLDHWYPLSLEQIIAITDKNKPQVPVPKPLPPPEPAAEPVPEPASEPEGRSKRDGLIAGGVEEGREGRRDGMLTRGSESEGGEGEGEGEETEEESEEEDEEWDDEVEFYEAQMQWAAEEELFGEKMLSDLGHPLSLCLEQPPPLCPLCCARTHHQGGQLEGRERSAEAGRAVQECAPAVFCVSCGEFFCHRCFHEFHITPRLQQHATHPIASSQTIPPAAPADAQNGYSPLNQNLPQRRRQKAEAKGLREQAREGEREEREGMMLAAREVRAEERRDERERREEERERRGEERRSKEWRGKGSLLGRDGGRRGSWRMGEGEKGEEGLSEEGGRGAGLWGGGGVERGDGRRASGRWVAGKRSSAALNSRDSQADFQVETQVLSAEAAEGRDGANPIWEGQAGMQEGSSGRPVRERLREEYEGRPVELSMALVGGILAIYKAAANADANANAASATDAAAAAPSAALHGIPSPTLTSSLSSPSLASLGSGASQPSVSARHSDSALAHIDPPTPLSTSHPPLPSSNISSQQPQRQQQQQQPGTPFERSRAFSWMGPRVFSRSASSPTLSHTHSHTTAAPHSSAASLTSTLSAAATNSPWSSVASLPGSIASSAAAVAGVAPDLPEDDVCAGDSAPGVADVTVTYGENVTVTNGENVTVTDVQVVLDYLASEAGTAHRHELQRFRILSELLADMQPQQLGHSERLAFWINVYNALAMHAYLVYGQPRSHYKRVMFMHKSAYIIAGLPFSILAIEHCILRAASFQPALAGLLPVQRYRRGDVRYSLALDRPEPLVTFALSCGCASAPPVRVYHPDTVHEQLKAAAQEYIQANVKLHPGSGKILLPKLLHWYSKDFARNAVGLLQWAAEQMEDGQKHNILQAMGAAGGSRKVRLGRVPVQVLAYDWTFQYLLA
ncbi:unnamed protein product [Closterium sp. NIES-64]|nr:unnamed protein product [Closterium sp. NIES-64]